MKEILIFAAGVLIGGWVDHRVSLPGLRGDDPPVYLNGGSFSSTTIGLIYGYVDDMEGCTIHAAGMNYFTNPTRRRAGQSSVLRAMPSAA